MLVGLSEYHDRMSELLEIRLGSCVGQKERVTSRSGRPCPLCGLAPPLSVHRSRAGAVPKGRVGEVIDRVCRSRQGGKANGVRLNRPVKRARGGVGGGEGGSDGGRG